MTNPLLTCSEPTPQAKLLDDYRFTGRMLLSAIRDHVEHLWRRTWQNPELTPQEAWAALGTHAVGVLASARLLTEFVNDQVGENDPLYLSFGIPDGSAFFAGLGITSTFTVEPQADGSVVVTETPAPPPEEPEELEEPVPAQGEG